MACWVDRASGPRPSSSGCEFANFLTLHIVCALQFHSLSSLRSRLRGLAQRPALHRAAENCSLCGEKAALSLKGKEPVIPLPFLWALRLFLSANCDCHFVGNSDYTYSITEHMVTWWVELVDSLPWRLSFGLSLEQLKREIHPKGNFREQVSKLIVLLRSLTPN